jgi:hypothetical protein
MATTNIDLAVGQDQELTTPVEIRFRAATGSRFNKSDAERIGPELLRLKKKHGVLTKDLLVQKAHDTRSVLHDDFNWDDASAAHAHRLEQARYILRSIMIVWDESTDDGGIEQVSTRLFHSVRADSDEDAPNQGNRGQRIHVTFRDVVENPEYAQQVIDSMERAVVRLDTRFRFYLDKVPMFAERYQAIFDEITALEDGTE